MSSESKINPKELRIGNYLQDGVSKELLTVSDLTEDNITSCCVDRSKYPLPDGWYAAPIPLTKEWLEKLGARKVTEADEFNCETWSINFMHYQVNGWNLLFEGSVCLKFPKINSVHINYVHQLQNLHFLLTGTELEIKE